MPIVINEIEINVEVTPGSNSQGNSPVSPETLKEAIVKECVEKILEIIKLKNER
jgi:hypothetical protein